MMALSHTAVRALELVREGNGPDADDLMVTAAENALMEFGMKSPAYSGLLYEHAVVCLANGSEYEAVEFLHRALGAAPLDQPGQIFKAKVLAELGTLHCKREEFEEAIRSLEECVQVREKCFGTAHPEYAAALLDLAEALVRDSQIEEALTRADQAREIFEPIVDPLAFDALTISCLARISLNVELPDVFDLASKLSTDDLSVMVDRMIDKMSDFSPQSQYHILVHTFAAVDQLETTSNETRVQYLEQLGFHARKMGEYDVACKHWQDCEALGRAIYATDPFAFLNARFEWAATLLDAGSFEYAESILSHTLAQTKQLDRLDMVSDTLRQYARFLSRRGRFSDAEGYLHEAIALAESEGENEALCLTDYGVFLSHCGRYDEAMLTLRKALEYETSQENVRKKIHKHLAVKSDGDVCGCYADVDIERVWRAVLEEVDPRKTLEKIFADVTLSESGDVQVQLLRNPKRTEEWTINKFTAHFIDTLAEERGKLNKARLIQSGLR